MARAAHELMLRLSLGVNILVLAPVLAGLLLGAARAASVFGAPSPARGILTAVYAAILAASAALLLMRDAAAPAAALLGVQVAYKLLTPLTVGTLRNPVVVANLGVAALHSATLAAMWAAARARKPARVRR